MISRLKDFLPPRWLWKLAGGIVAVSFGRNLFRIFRKEK